MKRNFLFHNFFESVFPSAYQIKKITITSLIRFLFLLVAFSIYFLSIQFSPSALAYKYEIAMIVTLTILTLVFLPPFDYISLYLKNKFLSEYLSLDESVSRLAYKKFDINSLIKSVFPDMVKIAGSKSGRLALLKEDDTFDIYTFHRGRQKKVHTREDNTPMNLLIRFLLKKKKGISISETLDYPEINEDFVALRADYIIPFIFREKIFGFLATSSIPDSEALNQLNFLSHQCAVIIHNQNLSNHIVENLKYRQEEESANRIQSALQRITPPSIPGLKITPYNKEYSALMVEFFQTQDGTWNFLILTAGGPIRSSGLIHSYIRGLLYSRVIDNRAGTFVEIKEIIQQTFHKAEWKEKYGYMIGKLMNNMGLELLQEGIVIKVINEKKPDFSLASVGWKNIIDPGAYPLVFELNNKPILRIEKE